MQRKPFRWNVSPALIAPEARGLWRGLAFIAPLWGETGGKGALLGPHGGPLSNANPVAGSTYQRRGTPYGLGVGISGASNLLQLDNYEPIVTSDGVGTGDLTMVVLANPVTEARISWPLAQGNIADNTNLYLGFNNSVGANNIESGTFAFTTRNLNVFTSTGVTGGIDGRYHLFGGRRRGTVLDAFIDGALRNTASGTVRDIATGALGIAIGQRPEDTTLRIATSTTIVLAAAWNRALTDAEMRMLARDPFCMFRPQVEWSRMWSAGGSTVLNPADLTDGFEYETPVFSQAHHFNPADAFHAVNFETPAAGNGGQLNPAKSFLAPGFETPGLLQQHLFAAQAMDYALPFEAATLSLASSGGPPFRSRAIGNYGRTQTPQAELRRQQIAASTRSRTITE